MAGGGKKSGGSGGGENSKKAAGNARKAEAAAQKEAAARGQQETHEDEKWNRGAKSTAKKSVNLFSLFLPSFFFGSTLGPKKCLLFGLYIEMKKYYFLGSYCE
jgi:hypothetical protein